MVVEKLQTSCLSWLLCYCNHIHDKLDELLHLPLELFHCQLAKFSCGGLEDH